MNLLENRKARFDYELTDNIEAGIALTGWEVKSLRKKEGNLKGAWVKLDKGEAWLVNCKITPWKFGEMAAQDPHAPRKLLLHKKEILKLSAKQQEQKIAVVPLKIYMTKGKIKCELGIGKGRKRHEKKQVLKERSIDRAAQQDLKRF
jgi:SsrA-binding protein